MIHKLQIIRPLEWKPVGDGIVCAARTFGGWYQVSRDGGSHLFSVTFEDHDEREHPWANPWDGPKSIPEYPTADECRDIAERDHAGRLSRWLLDVSCREVVR